MLRVDKSLSGMINALCQYSNFRMHMARLDSGSKFRKSVGLLFLDYADSNIFPESAKAGNPKPK